MVKMDPNEEVPATLENLVRPHIESFDWFLDHGIRVRVEGEVGVSQWSDDRGGTEQYRGYRECILFEVDACCVGSKTFKQSSSTC